MSVKVDLRWHITVWSVLFPPTLIAATSSPPAANPIGAGLVIALAIVYLSRRRAIGGWLLYFYVQLYFGVMFTLLFSEFTLNNFTPASWDSSKLYVFSLLSTVPAIAAQLYVTFAGTLLLFRRNARTLRAVRIALGVLAVASGISLAIDLTYFSESPTLFLEFFTFGFTCVWWAYFLKSSRVHLVFVENAWNYKSVHSSQPITPVEKRYLRRRALVIACITFVLLLVLVGIGLGDKKPDMEIFVFPVAWGLIAGLIALAVPIRKSKRAALVKTQTPAL